MQLPPMRRVVLLPLTVVSALAAPTLAHAGTHAGPQAGAQGGAQAGARRENVPLTARDSMRADSIARRLDRVTVTVTRNGAPTERAPWAVAALGKAQLAGAQATLGIDEALSNIPGVVVSNRYNYSVDQRLSIRGAGARANFGLRGVKVLLDGVPQSLPDGQSQLTNIDLADISRVEVLRGSASSLYGNGSGGVIEFTTDLASPDRLGQTARVTAGSYGLTKVQSRTAGRTGSAVGSLSLSRTTTNGTRQYSRADTRQAMAAVDYSLREGTLLAFRGSAAETPTALNPGALTIAEYTKNPDSAAAINVARGASRAISQSQFSLRLAHTAPEAISWAATAYVVRRFVDNPLATTPPGASVFAVGTYSTINRWVTGARLDGSRAIGEGSNAPRLSAGLDLQRSYDVRRNRRATGGHPSAATDTLLLHQDEIVSSAGPFAQVDWSPTAALTLNIGARMDRLRFEVKDHFMGDKVDNSGTREMSATTGHAGLSYAFSDAFTPYANYSTAFETPTTTELNARPDGSGGFNPDLGPQRIRTRELGARGAIGRLSYTASAFQSSADEALIQYLALDGRAFFRNAGRTKNEGLELGLNAHAASWLDVSVAWTEARYTFDRYRIVRGAVTDTLDGKEQAGIPGRYIRLGLRSVVRGVHLDLDHTWSAAQWADDRNTQRIDGWGRGVMNVRAMWNGTLGATRIQPFAGVNNAMNQKYIGAVTLNGAGGRTIEPAPLRNYYLGMELGWRVAK